MLIIYTNSAVSLGSIATYFAANTLNEIIRFSQVTKFFYWIKFYLLRLVNMKHGHLLRGKELSRILYFFSSNLIFILHKNNETKILVFTVRNFIV